MAARSFLGLLKVMLEKSARSVPPESPSSAPLTLKIARPRPLNAVVAPLVNRVTPDVAFLRSFVSRSRRPMPTSSILAMARFPSAFELFVLGHHDPIGRAVRIRLFTPLDRRPCTISRSENDPREILRLARYRCKELC